MKISNFTDGWQMASRLNNPVLVLVAGMILIAGTAWGDTGRGRERESAGHDDRRAHFSARAERWRELPPERQDRLRQRYEQFRRLPADEQQRVREEYRRFRQLPEEQRRAVKERWRQMSPEERQKYRHELQERSERGRQH